MRGQCGALRRPTRTEGSAGNHRRLVGHQRTAAVVRAPRSFSVRPTPLLKPGERLALEAQLCESSLRERRGPRERLDRFCETALSEIPRKKWCWRASFPSGPSESLGNPRPPDLPSRLYLPKGGEGGRGAVVND